MASYTAEQLSGVGTPVEELLSGSNNTFTITRPTNLKGSGYFTFESVRNSVGSYFGKDKNANGTISSLVGIQSLLQSPYIFSVVVEPGGGSFTFIPDVTVPISGAMLRATGGLSLGINVVGSSFIVTQDNDPLITEGGDNIIIE
tara:strand:- start:915 stop:1346 length:432 start_codon:yes stop_codon:yes gene_type:complete